MAVLNHLQANSNALSPPLGTGLGQVGGPARLPRLVAAPIAIALLAMTGCHLAASGQNATGVRLFEQGQYSAALQQFQQVINTDPANADGYYNLARSQHELGKQRRDLQELTQAEALYNQCLDHDPNHLECHRALAVLLGETGRRDRAFALLKNWAARNPNSAEPRIELARLFQENNDPSSEKKHLEDAVEIDPTSARAWLALARHREQRGDLRQALQNYQQSLAHNNLQPLVAAQVSARVAELSRQISSDFQSAVAGGRLPVGGRRGTDANRRTSELSKRFHSPVTVSGTRFARRGLRIAIRSVGTT